MDIDLNNIDFAIAVNTFHDDIQDKLQILSKMELEFLRKFQHRVQISEHHSEMIFQIRKIVSNIEEMYKDIKDYFIEMKVQFVYDFVRKIQTLMVIGYNHLSQALLITFDMYETQKTRQKQTKGSHSCSCKTKNDYILSKDEMKRLQHIDYTITSLQSQEQRLLMQMQTIYDRMMMQKSLIEKVKPSLASKELQEMKDHIETVMENNERLFEQNYMMKFFQFHKHIKQLDKPQKITEVYNQMNDTLKQNFIKHTMKAADRIERGRRHLQENMQSVEVQTVGQLSKTKTKKDLSSTRQPNSPSLFKQSSTSHYNLTKERKLNEKINIELNHLQKQNLSLTQELNSYKFAEKQIEVKYRELAQKFQVVQEMYKKAKMELQELKNGQEWNMHKLQMENNRIKQQIANLRGKMNNGGQQQSLEKDTQTDRFVSRCRSRAPSGNHVDVQGIVIEQKQTQTYEEYLIPTNNDEVIKLLKNRNEKAIILMNEKDRKIRETSNKIGVLEDETKKIKSSLNIFLGTVEEKFSGFSHDNSKQNTFLNNEQANQTSKKHSILEMNSYQIGEKISQILKLIVPLQISHQKNQELNQKDGKFKKLNPHNEQQLYSLPDQEDCSNDTANQLTHGDPNQIFSGTISDFRSQMSNNRKKKRLSAINILTNIKHFKSKIDAQSQTQPNETQKPHEKSSKTRQFQTQTMINDQNHNVKAEIQNSIQTKRQRPRYEQSISTNRKRKQYPLSNRNSQTALQSRQRKTDYRVNVNTFERIKIDDGKKVDYENSTQNLQRTYLSQSSEAKRAMIATSSLAARKDKPIVDLNTARSGQAYRMSEIAPFSNHRDQNGQRLSSLLEDSMQAEKMESKYNQSNGTTSYDMRINIQKQLSDTFCSTTVGSFNLKQKPKLKKNCHTRLVSEMPSTFRPISELSQLENNKQDNAINISYCPNNTFAGGSLFKSLTIDPTEKRLALTSNDQFTKLKTDHLNLDQRSQSKKKSLLLSIQKYKVVNTNINDILLGKYLTKVIQKWGKDRVKQTINGLLAETFKA